jgi:hypothetical protein
LRRVLRGGNKFSSSSGVGATRPAQLTGPEESLTLEGGQCSLLRDLFGSPFRSVALDSAWLAWRGGLLSRLAPAAYEQRQLPSGHLDPERLAVLADALEKAGADASLVAHLPEAGPHWRGCWAVDVTRKRSGDDDVGLAVAVDVGRCRKRRVGLHAGARRVRGRPVICSRSQEKSVIMGLLWGTGPRRDTLPRSDPVPFRSQCEIRPLNLT